MNRALCPPVHDSGRHVWSLPVVHSVLSADGVLELVQSAYGLRSRSSCYLLKPSLNDTYFIDHAGEPFIARVYGVSWRQTSDVAYELELLQYLARQGVAVAAPVATIQGSLSCRVEAPEGSRHLALFTYARGKPLSWDNLQHAFMAGYLLAHIHQVSDSFSSRNDRLRLDLRTLMDAPLQAIQPLFAHRPEDLRILNSIARSLRARAEAAIAGGLDFGPCHGDFVPKNMHISDRDEVSAFDFDQCGAGWRIYDFTSFYRLSHEHGRPDVWESFVSGYKEERPYCSEHLEAVPVFRALRELFMMAQLLLGASHWGFSAISDEKIEGWLTSFRRWQEEEDVYEMGAK